MKKIIAILLGVLGVVGISFGMANPASWYCSDQGGTIQTRTDTKGNEYSVCVFDNGTSCEEWAFYNGKCEKGSLNDADRYCTNHGGAISGDKCLFDNGRSCNKWDYYNHKCSKYDPIPPTPKSNPAKHYCVSHGGNVETVKDDSGYTYDLCHLPSGVECGLWQFYNGTCTNPPNNSNPASRYCNQNGGELDIWEEATGGVYSVCKFDDGSECETWDYFQGRCNKGDYRFNNRIKNKINNILDEFYKNATHQHLLDALDKVNDSLGDSATGNKNYGAVNHLQESLKKAAQNNYYGLGADLNG